MEVLDKWPKETATYMPLTSEETEQLADIQTNLSTYVEECTAKFLIGDMDIDKDWDTYINELEKIGYKTVVEVYQTSYDRLAD